MYLERRLNLFFFLKVVYCGLPEKGMNSYWEFGATSAIALYFCNRGFKAESGDQQRSCYVDPSDQVIKCLGTPLNCTGDHLKL